MKELYVNKEELLDLIENLIISFPKNIEGLKILYKMINDNKLKTIKGVKEKWSWKSIWNGNTIRT